MRMIAAIALAALALAACGKPATQSAQTNGASSAAAPQSGGGGLFPDLFAASYRLEAIAMHDGKTTPMVMVRSGRKMRMEMQTNDGPVIVILDPDTQQSIMVVNQGGRQMAIRTSNTPINDINERIRTEMAAKAHRTGSCSVANEHGQQWEHVDDGGANPSVVCITDDGIPLRSTENGQITWEATSLQRGPQSADNFRAPAGVRVMDLGPGAAAAMAAAMNHKPSGGGGQ
jgi:hypothetical protein